MTTYQDYATSYVQSHYNSNHLTSMLCSQRIYVFPVIGELDLPEIRSAHLHYIADEMRRRGRTSNHIRCVMVVTRNILNQAVHDGWITSNPYGLEVYFTSPGICPYPRTLQEYKLLLNTINLLLIRNFCGFLLNTGLKPVCAKTILLSQIDLEAETIILSHPSSNLAGAVRIPNVALPFVQAEIEKRNQFSCVRTEHFFLNEKGRPISREDQDAAIAILRTATGYSSLKLHWLSMAYPYLASGKIDSITS